MNKNTGSDKTVFIVINSFGKGGAEMSLAILADQLAKQSFRVFYIALWQDRQAYDFDWIRESGVEIIILSQKQLGAVANTKRLYALCQAYKPGFIYSAMLLADLASSFCSKILSIPHAVSIRTNPAEFYKKQKLKQALLFFILRFQKNIVFISHRALREYRATGLGRMLGKKNYFVIHNPIVIADKLNEQALFEKLSATKKKIQEFLDNKDPGVIELVMASRLVAGKGVMETVVQLEKPLRDNRLHLSIYGSGELEEILANHLAASADPSHIKLKGFSTQLDKAFGSSDVFIFPSRNEGFGRVVFEALLQGNLVICYHQASVIDEFTDNAQFWAVYRNELNLKDIFRGFASLDVHLCVKEIQRIRYELSPESHVQEFRKVMRSITDRPDNVV